MIERPKRSWWGGGAAALFGGFVAFILALVMYASLQDFQLVEEGYYEQGLEYQDRIDRRSNSRALAEGLEIAQRLPENQIVISWSSPNASAATGQIRMMRPSNARLDRQWSLSLDDSGQQRLATDDLVRGRWRLEVDWSHDSVNYLNEADIVIP